MTATPLPEPDYEAYSESGITFYGYHWNAASMTAHELAGYKRGLEAAAKIFEPADNKEHSYYAMHIRSLGEQK